MSGSERLKAALQLRCPRCLTGKLYRNAIWMNKVCPQCGLSLKSDPGFYIGSIYPNFTATVVLVTVLYWGMSLVLQVPHQTTLWICCGFMLLFPIWFQKYARSIWMSFLYNLRLSSAGEQKNSIPKSPVNQTKP